MHKQTFIVLLSTFLYLSHSIVWAPPKAAAQSYQQRAHNSTMVTTNLELLDNGNVIKHNKIFYFIHATIPCTQNGINYLANILKNKTRVSKAESGFPAKLGASPRIELLPNGLQLSVYANATTTELREQIIQQMHDTLREQAKIAQQRK